MEGITAEPTDEQLDQLIQFLGVEPHASAIIAENRAACGPRGHSGFPGGCNAEAGDWAESFVPKLGKTVGESQAKMLEALGIVEPVLSVTGPYKGDRADLSVPIEKGLDVQVHNKFNWKQPGLKPPDAKQQRYRASVEVAEDKARSKRRRRDPEPEEAEDVAPAWGGSAPDSLDPYDNWGTNHPMHKRGGWDPEGGAGGTTA
jgi:hypothetical protein